MEHWHADAGTVVDANIAEKLAQLKNQIATLEKREERCAAYYFSSRICYTFCLL
jgi:mitotic spindle assembly checkpoint protein MAD1